MKHWIGKTLAAVALLGSVLVMFTLLVELVGRATGLLELQPSATQFSATKGYELTPDLKTINSHGLRDQEFPLVKPTHTFRILALGDSFTYGHGLRDEETYVKQLEAMLNQKLGNHGIRYEVLNAGVPGYNTHQELIHLQEVGLLYHPDVILIGFTMSDAELGVFGLKNIGGRNWPTLLKEWIKDHFALYQFIRLRLKRLVDRIEAAKYSVKVGGTSVLPLQLAAAGKTNDGWELCRQSLEKFAAIGGIRGIPVLLIIYPFLGQLDDTYPFRESHALIARTATGYGMGIVDLLPHFTGQEPSGLWVSPTDSHPNGFANTIAARGIFDALIAYRLLPASPSP
ncbi:MAG TPA: GDSL-type esterase/lipase family protein [Candidatus Binatia bacterium]|nr:GDSL-type esterase/lipase family protein [Candidatus Binatia bacterium]